MDGKTKMVFIGNLILNKIMLILISLRLKIKRMHFGLTKKFR